MEMGIKDFYINAYPKDELGDDLKDNTTFSGLLVALVRGDCVYEYIGEGDSIIRERLFEKLASILEKPYNYIFDLWLENLS